MDDLISRSDAIGAVKEERFPIDSDYAEGFMAALDKVEWILKEWLPSAQPDSKETSSTHKALDTISRQAVIKVNRSYHGQMPNEVNHRIWKEINDLPSAQPETHEERTKTHECDCIDRQALMKEFADFVRASNNSDFAPTPTWNDAVSLVGSMPSAQPDSKELSFTQKKLDTISRQAAIRWVKTECNPYGKPTLDFESGKKVIEHLKQMPSAQPELPEWAQKVEEYRKSAPSFVRNQLVWALYQTWKEYDGRLVHQRGKENR